MTSPANGTSALSTFVTSAATHSSTNISLMAAIFMILGMSFSPLAPWHQCSLSALQPECHIHSAIQLDSSGKLDTCLLWTAYPIIQDTEAVVAMGQKWTHPQFVSQGEGLTVMSGGQVDVWKLATYGNVAKETVGMRL